MPFRVESIPVLLKTRSASPSSILPLFPSLPPSFSLVTMCHDPFASKLFEHEQSEPQRDQGDPPIVIIDDVLKRHSFVEPLLSSSSSQRRPPLFMLCSVRSAKRPSITLRSLMDRVGK
jgi:hypothetical protein